VVNGVWEDANSSAGRDMDSAGAIAAAIISGRGWG
jgi:hypothetical protein